MLATLDEVLAERPKEALARPVRILVPSRSLREHLAATVARRRRATLGLDVQTVYGFAADLCARVDGILPRGKSLTRLAARRAAAANRELQAEFAHLEDGPGTVIASVRDLLDAGFEAAPDDEDTASRLLLALGGRDRDVARARALLAVARETQAETRRWGGGGATALLRRACAHIARDPALVSAWAILVHGFADTTDAVGELLARLAGQHGASVFLDAPPDPGPDGQTDFGGEHLSRLRQRFDRVAASVTREVGVASRRLSAFSARGPDDEAWQVATRVVELLQRGERPEGIGVVARDPGGYRVALRSRFHRLGIPFSGVSEVGPAGPAARLAASLAMLLTRGGEAPAERLLELAAEDRRSGLDARVVQDVRLAFHSLGAARVSDVGGLDATLFLDADDGLPLLVRQGRSASRDPPSRVADDSDPEGVEDPASAADEDDRAQPEQGRRRVAGAHIRHCIRVARDTLLALDQWPQVAEVRSHAGWVRGLLGGVLGDRHRDARVIVVLDTVDGVFADLPGQLRVEKGEVTRMLAAALATCGRAPIGGSGGGVQLLSVTEARARTFEHLFLIGMNRDVFPRAVSEDPLLPDHLRARIAVGLPALASKRGPGFHEERYLFAQLMSASPDVTLSWQRSDDDGRPRAPSPLLERVGAIVLAEGPATRSPELDLTDLAVQVGLRGTREEAAPILRVLAEEVVGELGAGGPPAARLADCRQAVLQEVDPDRRTREGNSRARALGPYLGFLGPVASAGDPRTEEPFVTGVEKLVACGWQYFLENLLCLERLPDPLASLPSVDPLIVGEVVHGVLERVVRDGVGGGDGESLERALAREPRDVPWPAAEVLASWLRAAAEGAVREAGTGLAGLASLYVELARPQIETARAMDWTVRGAVPALGAEVQGRLVLADPGGGLPRAMRFRVDRVDRPGAGPRLTDYKTGRKGVSAATRADKRREHLLQAVREGRHLQPAVYALGAGPGATGRLLYLAPDTPHELRELTIGADDREVDAALRAAAADVFAALAAGSLLPRVVTTDLVKEPRRCDGCRVAEACVRGDSGVRGRISAWVERHGGGGDDVSAAEHAWLGLWRRGAGGVGGSAHG